MKREGGEARKSNIIRKGSYSVCEKSERLDGAFFISSNIASLFFPSPFLEIHFFS